MRIDQPQLSGPEGCLRPESGTRHAAEPATWTPVVRVMSHPARVDACQARGCRAAAVRASAALYRQADPAHPQVCVHTYTWRQAEPASGRVHVARACAPAWGPSAAARAPLAEQSARPCWCQFVRSGSLRAAPLVPPLPREWWTQRSTQSSRRISGRLGCWTVLPPWQLPRGGGGGCCCGPRPGVRMI